MKIKSLLRLFVLVSFFTFFVDAQQKQLNAQTQCSSAVLITPTDWGRLEKIVFDYSQLEYWVKIPVDSSTMFITLTKFDTIESGICVENMEVFTGECGHLHKIAAAQAPNFNIDLTGLHIGDTLYLCISRKSYGGCYFGLIIRKIPGGTNPPLPSDPCSNFNYCTNLVVNPDFDVIPMNTWGQPTSTSTGAVGFMTDYWYNPSGLMGPNNISIRDNTSSNLPWDQTAVGMLFGTTQRFLLCDGDQSFGHTDAIWRQEINLIPGIHGYNWSFWARNLFPEASTLQYPEFIVEINGNHINFLNGSSFMYVGDTKWVQLCGKYNAPVGITTATFEIFTIADIYTGNDLGIDHIQFGPTMYVDLGPDVTICEGQSQTLCSDISNSYGTTYNTIWNTGDVTTLPPNNCITVAPSQTTTYTITATNTLGCQGTSEVVVNVIPKPDFEILGDNSICTDVPYPYSATNSSLNYFWEIIPSNAGTFQTPQTGSNVSIMWDQSILASNVPTQLVLQATDPSTGCIFTSTLNIFSCCRAVSIAPNVPIDYFNVTASSFGSTNYQYPGNYMFHGTFTVDVNFELKNSPHISFSQDAKIIVLPGVTFKITNSNLSAGCNWLWKGIYLSDPSSKLIVTNSTIKEALNAVYTTNNAALDINNTIFENNYIGIIAEDFVGTVYPPIQYNANLKANTFTFSGTNLLPPKQTESALCGIKIDDVGSFTLDKPGISNANYFTNLRFGVYSTNSSIKICNSIFTNIKKSTSEYDPKKNAAVYSTFNMYASPFVIKQANIGAAPNLGNRFYSCNIGVYTENLRANIRNNNFYNHFYNAIYCIDIKTNSFVNNNNISTSGIGNNLPGAAIAIRNVLTSSNGLKVDVSGNTISTPKTGILLTNLESGPGNHVTVGNNTITMNFTVGSPWMYTGIKVESCNGIDVALNTIQNFGNLPNVSDITKLKGITTELTTDAAIHDNDLFKMGIGMFVLGNVVNTQYSCNSFGNCRDGFVLENALLSSQGTTIRAQDNQWTNNSNFRLEGTLNNTYSINWFYRTNPAIPYTYSPINITSGLTYFIPYPINPPSICIDNGGNGNTGQGINALARESKFGAIARDEILYNQWISENKVISKQHLYKTLKRQPQWLALGVADDSTYQTFFQNEMSSNIGTLEVVLENADTSNFDEGLINNLLIQPENEAYENWITANNAYLAQYAKHYQLDNIQIQLLADIANLNPTEGGGAVYAARVMLGLDIDDPIISGNKIIMTEENEIWVLPEKMSIYPNPNNGSFAISKCGTFQIFDITGKKIKEFYVEKEEINNVELEPGMYLYRIIENGEIIEHNKMIIVK